MSDVDMVRIFDVPLKEFGPDELKEHIESHSDYDITYIDITADCDEPNILTMMLEVNDADMDEILVLDTDKGTLSYYDDPSYVPGCGLRTFGNLMKVLNEMMADGAERYDEYVRERIRQGDL